MVTFSKRRKGLFKKAHELHCLTGTDIAVVAFSPAGHPFTHGEPSFESTIDKSWLEGIKVEACESVDDLVLVKNVAEEIRNKILFRAMEVDEDFVRSLLA
ncbi:agamous-like MADS-box protein AGL61 [Rhododendron vialii]|uniref:agamous-like MADS-box protein AGL61 n=1 Tax=Rhododendron vialii TaxID=182163 RepID=UPI00265E7A76|nr:agamous-like MADS-box protein AGL61 [Rhododendron vialii]